MLPYATVLPCATEQLCQLLNCLQMVDRYDQGVLPRQDFSNSYASLYKLVQKALYRTHVEGQLKSDIMKEPESYVELDPDMAKTLMDQRQAVSSHTAPLGCLHNCEQ